MWPWPKARIVPFLVRMTLPRSTAGKTSRHHHPARADQRPAANVFSDGFVRLAEQGPFLNDLFGHKVVLVVLSTQCLGDVRGQLDELRCLVQALLAFFHGLSPLGFFRGAGRHQLGLVRVIPRASRLHQLIEIRHHRLVARVRGAGRYVRSRRPSALRGISLPNTQSDAFEPGDITGTNTTQPAVLCSMC
jgi:hypothetical protein